MGLIGFADKVVFEGNDVSVRSRGLVNDNGQGEVNIENHSESPGTLK